MSFMGSLLSLSKVVVRIHTQVPHQDKAIIIMYTKKCLEQTVWYYYLLRTCTYVHTLSNTHTKFVVRNYKKSFFSLGTLQTRISVSFAFTLSSFFSAHGGSLSNVSGAASNPKASEPPKEYPVKFKSCTPYNPCMGV